MEKDIEVVLKFKEFLNSMLKNVNRSLKRIQRENEIKEELRKILKYPNKDNFDDLVELGTDKLQSYLETIIPDNNIGVDEIKIHLFFYEKGKVSSALKKSDRYTDAIKLLGELKSKMLSFSLKSIKNEEVELFEKNIRDIEEVLSNIKDNTIEGLSQDLFAYNFIFDYAGDFFSDEDKIHLYTLFVKANNNYLQKRENDRVIELEELRQKRIDENASSVKSEMDELLNIAGAEENEEVSDYEANTNDNQMQTSVVILKNIELDDDLKTRMTNIKDSISKYRGLLYEMLDAKKVSFNNLRYSILSKNLNLSMLDMGFLNKEDYMLFLAYCIDAYIRDINVELEETYKEEEIEFAKDVVLEEIEGAEGLIEILKSISKEDVPEPTPTQLGGEGISDDSTITVIFYDNDSEIPELEKNIKGFSKEKLNDVVLLIEELSKGNFSGKLVIKDGDKKLNVLRGKDAFISYRGLPNNHVLVYHAAPLEELNKNITNNKIISFNQKYYKRIADNVKDGNLEYRKLIDKNKKRFEELKDKVKGKGND